MFPTRRDDTHLPMAAPAGVRLDRQPAEHEKPTEEQLEGMLRDPRYWRDRDPAFVNRVTAGFKALYGSELMTPDPRAVPPAPTSNEAAKIDMREARECRDFLNRLAEDGRIRLDLDGLGEHARLVVKRAVVETRWEELDG